MERIRALVASILRSTLIAGDCMRQAFGGGANSSSSTFAGAPTDDLTIFAYDCCLPSNHILSPSSTTTTTQPILVAAACLTASSASPLPPSPPRQPSFHPPLSPPQPATVGKLADRKRKLSIRDEGPQKKVMPVSTGVQHRDGLRKRLVGGAVSS